MTFRRALRLIAWMATARAAVSAGLDYSPASPNAPQIDDFLRRKNSPLAGLGAALSGYAQNYDIDPRLVVAIAGAETTFGQHQCTANNAWNWFHRRTCPASYFASYQEGAEQVTKYLRLSYVNRGYDTIELIRQKYCAAGCDNWIPLVTSFYNAMPADGNSPPTQPPATPLQVTPPSSQPTPQPSGQTPQPAPTPTSDDTILGVPRYLAILLGVLLVGAWAFSTLKR